MIRKHREQLQPLLNKINDIENVNSGGCGSVVIYVHDYLQGKGVDSQIIYLMHTRDTSGISNLRNNKPDSCYHAMLRVGNHYVDSTGIHGITEGDYKFNSRKRVKIPITRKLAGACWAKKSAWNSWFKRRNVSKIKRILGV